MAVRRLDKSWQYDFTISGHGRRRQGGYKTKAEALLAEKVEREAIISGARQVTFSEALRDYLAATTMKDRSRDAVMRILPTIEKELGHLFVEDVNTAALDTFKQTLPKHLGPKSVNQYLIVIGAALRFMWKRGRLKAVPYIPREKVPKTFRDWYTKEERDQLLAGIFEMQPQWYLFFYVTARLGLRLGEVYALSRSRLREASGQIVVDRAVQRGTKAREAKLVERKNDEAYVLDVSDDVFEAIRWHSDQGYAGAEFLFSKTGEFARYIDSHNRPLEAVQEKLGLRKLGHHAIGRHSVASQAATAGTSIKAIQATLGHRSEQSTHKYAHLGSGAQLRVIEGLKPSSPPHGNVASTETQNAELAVKPTRRSV